MKSKILGKLGEPSFSGDINQCPSCLEVFNSTRAFDKHRVGSFQPNARRCMSESEMREAKMAMNAKGRWVTELMKKDLLERMSIREAGN